ncbi:hypothetical protein KHA80_16630 [Anaerobacillus sp. HL2]|nr:hypothetical protein KHA80_16630 [Anaerobacillus sp. HL2]
MYYGDLAVQIRLWIPYPQFSTNNPALMLIEEFNFEHVYYSGIAFAILFATKILLQIIGSMFDFLAHLPILNIIINGGLVDILLFEDITYFSCCPSYYRSVIYRLSLLKV